MAIKASGNLSMLDDIVAEFGGSEPHKISDYYSGGTLPTTGYITFSDFYGQSDRPSINLTIASNTNNYNIQSSRGGSYVAGSTDVTLTINSGVTVGSTSTSSSVYALQTGSGWSSGDTITIINNGTVKGKGANGGNGGSGNRNIPSVTSGTGGGTGGRAFRAQFATTFTNNGSVYGGGGGGGGGGSATGSSGGKLNAPISTGGGGGGGGAGVNGGSGGTGGTGTGGLIPGTGVTGSSGTATAGGAGGASSPANAANGGNGGGLGANGAAGQTPSLPPVNGRRASGGGGGLRGYYQVGSSFINGGSGIGGTVGGRSA